MVFIEKKIKKYEIRHVDFKLNKKVHLAAKKSARMQTAVFGSHQSALLKLTLTSRRESIGSECVLLKTPGFPKSAESEGQGVSKKKKKLKINVLCRPMDLP